MHKFNEELFQNALDLNETIVYEYDIQKDEIRFAENIKKYIPCAEQIGTYLENLEIRGKIYPEDIKRALAFFSEGGDDTKIRMEYLRFLDYKGEFVWYQVKGKLILLSDGAPGLLYGTFTCVDGHKDIDNEIKDIGLKDPLTRLHNRENTVIQINRYFMDIPLGVIAGVMIVDVDNFAAYRTLKGLQAAEGMLVEIARILKRALRTADIVGRYGKDQFLVCMKGVRDEKVYCERATYILDTVKRVWADYEDDCRLTVSIGIAVTQEEEEPVFSTLWDHAVMALEAAKSEKKDTFFLYDGELHSADQFKDIRISGREIDLVKSILDPMMTWAYAVDENFNLIYKNGALNGRVPGECKGMCYSMLKGYQEPCPDCPIATMKERCATKDCVVYSPTLRTAIHMRVTRLIMRNQTKVYIMSNVRDDVEEQLEKLKENSKRYSDAVFCQNDIVWDINLNKNTCTRLQEEKVMTVQGNRVENYQNLRKFFLDEVVHPEDRDAFLYVADPVRIRESQKMHMKTIQKDMRLLQQDGTYKWYVLTAVIEQEDVSEDDIFISGRDIDQSRKEIIEKYTAEERFKLMMRQSQFQMEIAQSNERYEHVNELTGIFVFEYDVPSREYYLCTTFEDIFNVRQDMLRNEWSLLEGLTPAKEDQAKFERFIKLVKTEPDTHEVTLRLITKFEAATWFTVTVQTLNGINNTLTRVLGILQNVNTEMEIKGELEFRAEYDSLTGLYNAENFYRKAENAICLSPELKFAILAIDITRFRVINDRFGIETGNRCLEYLGNVIKKCTPWDGVAGRYQADVFSMLVHYEKEQDLLGYMNAMDKEFKFEEAQKCGSNLSFGIYKIDDETIPIRLMCDRARLAKKEIKGNALCNYAVYDDKIRLQLREQAEIESEMQLALNNHEFVMYLQPKYDVHTEQICGAEALVRWCHPTRGIRMPGDFLPLFENNGFVKNLDEYMWERAAEYLAKLKQRGLYIPISVNISRLHINNSNLIEVLEGIVKKYDIEPRLLELEITENLFMEDVNELYETMMSLKNKGFLIEMDDFGSGYSSLNMLRNAPVDVIKIDRFFLDEIATTKRGRIVVENSIGMSKQLGLKVVAEGVETREQLEFVKNAGCDIVQGYYYSKPVPVEEFEKLL